MIIKYIPIVSIAGEIRLPPMTSIIPRLSDGDSSGISSKQNNPNEIITETETQTRYDFKIY